MSAFPLCDLSRRLIVMHAPLRVLELFCGIGGCAAALSDRARIVAAVDINQRALDVYRNNFSHPTSARSIESLPDQWFQQQQADVWWLSPPCQPYTRRGRRRDLEDPRAAALLALLEKIRTLRPPCLALENVPGFVSSRTHRLLRETLEAGKYQIRETLLCPTQLGLANRRLRYYLVASQKNLASWPQLEPRLTPLRVPQALDLSADPQLFVDPELVTQYRGALHLVDADDPQAVTACFTSAYGRSLVRSGSYLHTLSGVRRFSPREILRLLGFPESFELPPELPVKAAWALAGNSLSIPAVRSVFSALDERRGAVEEMTKD